MIFVVSFFYPRHLIHLITARERMRGAATNNAKTHPAEISPARPLFEKNGSTAPNMPRVTQTGMMNKSPTKTGPAITAKTPHSTSLISQPPFSPSVRIAADA